MRFTSQRENAAITGQLAQLRGAEPPEGRWQMKAGAREPRGPVTLAAEA